MKRFPIAAIAALPLLAAVAACSSGPGEDAQSSQEPLGIKLDVLSNVHVTADDASVTITYTRRFVPAFTLTLTGPNGTTTLPETSVNGASGAVFTGLDICTPFQFAILDAEGATLMSGNIHTLQTGNVACPASETMFPTHAYQFEGVYHWRNNADWCYESNYSQSWGVYPQAWPWWDDREESGATVGYEHYWDPGKKPLPCQEQGIHVYRTMYDWDVGASRKSRMWDATVQATATTSQICVDQWQAMGLGTWAYSSGNLNATNDEGVAWPSILPPGIGTGRGMAIIQGSTGQPLTVNGSTLTVDVKQQILDVESVSGGFAVPNDGFPIPQGGEPSHQSYPEDGLSCLTGLTNIGLSLQYDAITPDTPMNCSVAMNCEQFTVTCDGAPEWFEVHQNVNGADTIVGTAQGSTSGPVTISGTENVPGVPLTVCTASYGSSGKLTTCTGAIPVTSSQACPITCPICPSGYVCQVGNGTAICVVNTRCPVTAPVYCNGSCLPAGSVCAK